jgi:hypothetical protein
VRVKLAHVPEPVLIDSPIGLPESERYAVAEHPGG